MPLRMRAARLFHETTVNKETTRMAVAMNRARTRLTRPNSGEYRRAPKAIATRIRPRIRFRSGRDQGRFFSGGGGGEQNHRKKRWPFRGRSSHQQKKASGVMGLDEGLDSGVEEGQGRLGNGDVVKDRKRAHFMDRTGGLDVTVEAGLISARPGELYRWESLCLAGPEALS